MFDREWLFESFGEKLRLSIGGSDPHSSEGSPEGPPDEGDLWEIETLIFELHAALAHEPRRRKRLEQIFVSLTGRLPGNGEYRPFDLSGELYVDDLKRVFLAAATSGQLRIERVQRPRVSIRQELPIPLGPSGPAPTPSEATTAWFEVRFVDEVGDPIDGLEVVMKGGGKEERVTTDGDGVARLDGAESSFASVRVASAHVLGDIVEPRFAQGRVPRFPEAPFVRMPFSRDLPTVSLESEEQKLIVVTPTYGKLFATLLDKEGRELHVDTEYTIDGPVSFEGVTDGSGRLLHEDVPPGDYQLTLRVDVNRALKPATEGDSDAASADSDYEPEIEEYTAPIPVLAAPSAALERWVGVLPRVALARLRGMLFDTNKTFILPTAIPSLRQIRSIYEARNPSELLIVGHTDTSGEPSVNDPLSKKRADSMQQYLEDDVDGWLANYESSVPQKERWGSREDRLMMLKLPGYDARPPEKPPIEWYQEQHNAAVDAGAKEGRSTLTVDGKSGPKTRRELITDYMSLDGATLGDQGESTQGADDSDFHISIQTHGCGENFPLDESLATTDERPEAERNDQRDRHDRRVELFFFDAEFGVRPAATTADGAEYLKWRKLAAKNEHDFPVEGVNSRATVVPLSYAHFRTGSAVLLPEGEAPVSGAAAGTGSSPSSVCALAMALRFNEERPGHAMLIAGHTDSVGGEAGNQQLSEQRAQLVHAVLMGERDTFVDLAKETGKVEDWKQILKWSSVTFATIDPPSDPGEASDAGEAGDADANDADANDGEGELGTGFSGADPGTIDGNAATGQAAVRAFQTAYNENYRLLGGSSTITVDGIVGGQTWGAIFDLYQYNMAQELGEVDNDADESNPTKLLEGLDNLRGLVTFLPLSEEWIGLGEAHPTDGTRSDNSESQENRRVELLFFEQGQEPDVAILEEAPETTDLYLPDAYRRTQLPDRPGGAKRHWCYELCVFQPAFAKSDLEVQVESNNLDYSRTQTIPAGAGGLVSVVFDNIPSGALVTVAPKGAKDVGLIRQKFPVTRARGGVDAPQTSPPEWKYTPEPRLDFIGYSKTEDSDA